MPSSRPLATQLALTHGLIGLFACLAVGVLLALLLPGLYLQQREAALVHAGEEVAAHLAPALARGGPVPAPAPDAPGVSLIVVVDVQQRETARSASRGGGGAGHGWGGGRGMGPGPISAADTIWQPRWQEVLSGRVVRGRTALPSQGWVFAAAVPARHEGRVVGAVVVYARLAELAGSTRALVLPILLAAVLVGALAVLAGGWLARRMALPLRRMTELARRISEGDLSLRVEAPAWEEGESLAQAFNHMTESLSAQEQARRQFVADASHQLRAPLTSLQAQAEALLDDLVPDAPTRRRFLVRIVDDSRALSALAQELLDLERLEAGPRAPRVEAVALRSLLTQVAESSSVPGEAPVVTDLPGNVPSVLADPSEVRQALVNLVTNALQHAPAAGAVTLRAEAREGAVRVSVVDRGPGIAPEHLPLLWERFYRVPGDVSGGSGLGLTIAKRLVERQGGRVGAESRLGEGSTFWFELPTVPADLRKA